MEGQTHPQLISLFCGAGGLDLGFKQRGFHVAVAVDSNRAAVQSHQRNFPKTFSCVGDLQSLGPDGLLKLVRKVVPLGARIGVIGGPPCQGFSRANTLRSPRDPRNRLVSLYVDIIARLQLSYVVEFIVFENVPGIKDRKNVRRYRKLITELRALDFDIHENDVCALDYGVPQRRRRILLTGLRRAVRGSEFRIRKRKGAQTVGDAIGHLPEPCFFDYKLSRERIPHHPNHWTMRPKSEKFKTGAVHRAGSRSFKVLDWEKPSPTIAFGNREVNVHPRGMRRISVFEAMLLQGFPESYVLEGNLSQQFDQVSNAVPPKVARALAGAIEKVLHS